MKNKEIKSLFSESNDKINIPLSQRVLDEPIEPVPDTATSKPKTFRWKLAIYSLCLVVFSFSIFAVVLISMANRTQEVYASNLTSYIIEINPSFCITTDNQDMVVSVVSLNLDGNEILSDDFFSNISNAGISLCDCLKKIINLTNINDFIKSDSLVKVFTINNQEQFAREKGKNAQLEISKDLEELGKDIPVEFYYMEVEEFKNRMNFEGESEDLDNFIEEIKCANLYFNPNE